MAVGTNYWKIGLFVIIGAVASIGLLLVVGAKNWSKETVQYVTYFDESVQGLDQGAPVRFRGVMIGSVEAIEMAPDRRLVEVRMALDEHSVRILGSAVGPNGEASAARTQLAQAGLTGQRFVLVDVFNAQRYPEQALPFPTPERYLSSVPSTLVQLENAVVQTSDQLPLIAERAVQTLNKIEGTLSSIDAADLPQKMSEGVSDARKTIELVNSELTRADIPETSKDLRITLQAMTKTLSNIDLTLQRINARGGVLSSIEGATASVQRVASGAQSVAPQIDTTLKEVQAAARSFRRLTDALEREPDMLLKGRVGSLP